ncbi:MAG: TetR/AcrR family transcriptional regulator [Deltaproteobacteria bacterium]
MANARGRLPRKPANQYHHGDLPRALLEAAVRTIQKRGVEALTLRAVGDELGVSRSALYRHFADKAALLATVAHEGFRMLRLELEAAWERSGRGLPGFTAMGEAYVRFAIAHPAHYRLMFGSGFDRSAAAPELREEGSRAFGVLVNAITQQRPGTLQPDDPERLAHFIWALVHGISMLAIDGALREGTDVEALTRYAIERMRTGIAAHGEAR